MLDMSNASAVFQATSLFNCLESVPIGCGPMDGVSRYAQEPCQGPAAAIACPASLVYRNYFCSEGRGQILPGDELNCLAELEQLLDNREKKYWMVSNGYCLPP